MDKFVQLSQAMALLEQTQAQLNEAIERMGELERRLAQVHAYAQSVQEDIGRTGERISRCERRLRILQKGIAEVVSDIADDYIGQRVGVFALDAWAIVRQQNGAVGFKDQLLPLVHQ